MKETRTILIVLLFTTGFFCKSPAQSRLIDSLREVLYKLPASASVVTDDTVKIKLLNRLSRITLNTGNYDSSLAYAERVIQLVKAAGQNSAYKKGLARAYNNIGLINYFKGNYAEGLKNEFAALKIQEEIGDKYGIAGSHNHIGLIHFNQGHDQEALKSHELSLKIKKEINDRDGIIASYVNLGNIYCKQINYPLALKNYYAAVNEAEKAGDRSVMATCYNNIGAVYVRQKNYDQALKNYQNALELRQNLNDKYNQAMTYYNMSDVYTKMKNYKEAESYGKRSLEMATEISALEMIKEANKALSALYEATGQPAKAILYFKAAVVANDSLSNVENMRKALQTQMQYQFDKKITADSVKTAAEKKVVAAQLKQERTLRFALFGGVILLVAFAVFMVNRFRVITRQKKIIEIKEKHAKKQKEIIAYQKDIVEGKQREILDSINYALRIQQALLASDDILQRNFNTSGTSNYFILFKPKDIVSGDFYWASELPGGEFLLTVADSTGHGVPGAIMSMLNIACLNEAVNKNISSPEQLLFETRKRVIEYLKDDGSREGGKDGMDCSVLKFDFAARVLNYAGANSPIWIIRGAELIELKPDKMPVGKHEREFDAFRLQTFQLQKGDKVYAFTDGFADQFGGIKGKKFMTSQLKRQLMEIASEPMPVQKQLLAETFEKWKVDIEQVDDVTVFGVVIS